MAKRLEEIATNGVNMELSRFQPVIPRKERHLGQTVGAPYDAYLARVPRFMPRFCGWEDRAERSIRTGRV